MCVTCMWAHTQRYLFRWVGFNQCWARTVIWVSLPNRVILAFPCRVFDLEHGASELSPSINPLEPLIFVEKYPSATHSAVIVSCSHFQRDVWCFGGKLFLTPWIFFCLIQEASVTPETPTKMMWYCTQKLREGKSTLCWIHFLIPPIRYRWRPLCQMTSEPPGWDHTHKEHARHRGFISVWDAPGNC